MKKNIVIALITMLTGLFATAGLALAAGKDDAKSLVKHAAAFVKYQGKGKALAEISKPKGQFDKGELYVFAYDLQGVMVAHPKNPTLIGKNLIDVPDNDGKLFRRDIVEKAKSKGSGWVDYMYLNPETNEVEHKTTYLQKVGDLIICCGAYKEYSHDGD
ncbi:MAG TPA: cache type 2 domain-containing protein [Desulfuromonadales bacterium]|nr:cache type 2 domain-containing protein [Desulfuromonadales bacterium]